MLDVSRLKEIEVSNLELDTVNPRLPKYVERTQESMFEFLAKSSSIDELLSAIAENGFFPAEALIAVPKEQKFVVVEGNRRLTALKILNGEVYKDIPRRILQLRDEAKHIPTSVPVYIFDDRSDILRYLGNRHIAGVKAWGALAKARYIRELFNSSDSSKTFSDRCLEIARIIGSRRDFISRTLRALRIYEVAEDTDFFGLKGVNEEVVKFSLISTAVDYTGISEFLYGSEDQPDSADPREPNVEHTKELFTWLFSKGSEGNTILGESRNLNRFSKVLASSDGLAALRKGATLEQAYLRTTGVNDDFDVLCNQAQHFLREANSIASEVDSNEVRQDIAISIARQARALQRAMEDE